MIERVQKRATKHVDGLKDVNYWDILEATGLISLEKCRIWGDLNQVFKIMKCIEKVDYKKFLKYQRQKA